MALMTMSFRRRGSGLRPVHSIKHVIDIQGGLVAGTQAVNDVISTVDAPVIANVTECETGSRVNALFLNIQVAASGTAALANVYMMIYKNPGNNIAVGQVPSANAVGSSDFKKQVFHQEMIMTEKNTTAISRTLFKGVIMIPKLYRRMAPNDKIIIALFAPGVTFDFCFQAIYKEFR